MALVWQVVAVVVNMRQVVCVICNLPALPHTIPVVVFYSSNGGTQLLSASQRDFICMSLDIGINSWVNHRYLYRHNVRKCRFIS